MRQLWVDFNDVDSHGQTTTLARFAEPGVTLSVGLHLLVGDDDGHICEAQVVDMSSDGSIVLALDLGTFRHSPKHARISA